MKVPAVALLALLISPVANASRLLAVLPLDTSEAAGKLTKEAQSSIEEMLRDVAANQLTPQGWTVLTGENTLQVLTDNGVNVEKCGNENCHLSMAREIKAEKFISGAVQFADAEFTASIRLIDVATGRILASERLEGATAKELRKEFEPKAAQFFARAGLSNGSATSDTVPVAAVQVPIPPASLGNVPKPPTAFKDDNVLGLDADADVLVAYDGALKAEKNGEANPGAARDAWMKLIGMKTANPYREVAMERAKKWNDFADQVAKFSQQHTADLEKLKKILPLESINSDQKGRLVANFFAAFGAIDLPTLMPLVPATGWKDICARMPAGATLPMKVHVNTMDVDGTVVGARVLLGGNAVGSSPVDVTANLCSTDKIGASELSTGNWAESPVIPTEGSAIGTRNIYFPVSPLHRKFDATDIVWATSASASSEYSADSWSARQATGAPNSEQCGDQQTAWATREADSPGEWLLTEYPSSVMARGVRVVETLAPGAVSEVAVRSGGQWVRVWSGKDPTTACPGNFDVRFDSPMSADAVKVSLVSESVVGWNEIDAVGLVRASDDSPPAHSFGRH